MKNFVKHSANVTLNAPYAVTSGQGLKVGSLFGVANSTAAISAPVEASITGSFDMAKATGTTFTQGAKVYWDDTARNMTATVGSNSYVGVATLAAASGDTVVRVRLNGVGLA